DDKGKVLLAKGTKITASELDPIPRKYWKDIEVEKGQETIASILEQLEEQTQAVEALFQEKIGKLSKGDELPPGVIKMVKVYIAIKRKLQVGDKMAGRHGNKGVVSRILPEEDMPYLPDGTPVDLCLNPLGVPSRMNVGQILETHLGWAGYLLGRQLTELMEEKGFAGEPLRKHLLAIYDSGDTKKTIEGMPVDELPAFAAKLEGGLQLATPVFDGAHESEIKSLLQLVADTAKREDMSSPLYHLSSQTTGQTVLFDGRTGEKFHKDVTV